MNLINRLGIIALIRKRNDFNLRAYENIVVISV